MNTNTSVAIIGATGMIGAPVANRLVEEGMKVIAVVRDIEKARVRLNSGITLRKGDLRAMDSLKIAFTGVDTVYLSLSTGPYEKNAAFKTEIDGVKNVIEASRYAGVKRIGFLSSLVKDYEGINWWVFDIKREACRILIDSDIPVTIFYPSNFFENLTSLQMVGNRVMLVGTQITKSWWVGTRDYSRQVAAALMQTHTENREYPVQGHEPMNFDEAADLFIKYYPYKNLKKTRVPISIVRALKNFSAKIDFNYRIVYAVNHYDEQFQSEQTWRDLGKPQLRLAEYTRTL